MADDSLSDRASMVNPAFQLSHEQSISSRLVKAQALIAVVLNDGLENCSKSTQHEYLSVLDDLLREALKASEKIGR